MAEESVTRTYLIQVDVKDGLISIDGLTNGFVRASKAADLLEKNVNDVNKSLKDTRDKTGLAGAVVVELGRSISDLNYGMTAVANNLQQMSTLFVTLISTSGGLTNGLRLMGAALRGPLGLIILFQTAITYLERLSKKQKEAKAAIEQTTSAIEIQISTLGDLSSLLEMSVGPAFDRAISAIAGQFSMFGKAIEGFDPASKDYKKRVQETLNIFSDYLHTQQEIKKTTEELSKISPYTNPDLFFETQRRLSVLILDSQRLKEALTPGEGVRGPDQEKALNTWDQLMTDILGYPVDQDTLMEALSLVYGDPKNEAIKGMQDRAKAALESMSKRYVDYGDTTVKVSKDVVGMMGLIGDSMVSLGEVVGEQSEVGKAIAVAGGLIDTAAAVLKALKQEGLPPGTRIPYAISVGAFGLAQVARMARVNPRGSRAGSGATGNAPAAPSITPSFNIVGGSRIDQLNDTIRQELGRPQRAYVVNKDVRSAGELERNIVNGATI